MWIERQQLKENKTSSWVPYMGCFGFVAVRQHHRYDIVPQTEIYHVAIGHCQAPLVKVAC